MPSANSFEITVSARGSKLSQAQVWEVHRELLKHHPHIQFQPTWITTRGDKDKKTSLRALDKTDFFTREVDQMQLQGHFRISIHSAKDLPEPLAPGLKIVALTQGVDPSDVLVYNHQLPQNALIATSSHRREQNLRAWREGFRFTDIRGTIEERLTILDSGQIDGVVMAEAALIRLGLIHRRRMPIPGETAPLQGRLAVIALESDHAMEQLFRCIHHAN
ncbi:MAG TPA: hydroxymethylbilane synthase [Rhabdochlamydiaceae bacterium]|jgi:hydroxymethylbilane synthase|nr:hydroxymethylbilane synthase [Rhabdochlamydiaceae bacterium]